MGVRILWALGYCRITTRHKWFVFLAGLRIGVPLWQLLVHDLSKYSYTEAFGYGEMFIGKKKDSELAKRSWLLHQNRNPHHWEYWISRTSNSLSSGNQSGEVAVEMPLKYVKEMVADWYGAGRAYGGTWNINAWLSKAAPTIVPRLHPNTRVAVGKVLRTQDDEAYLLWSTAVMEQEAKEYASKG